MRSTRIFRIIDAALNRAGEGLRVVEDYVRFVLDDPFLLGEVKSLRGDLADAAVAVPPADRHAARDTPGDVGTTFGPEHQQPRTGAWDVCAASLKRTEQALRSLEEYGKLIDDELAGRFEALRYRVYTLEKAIDIGRESRARLADVRLCVLVDGRQSPDDFEQLVAALVETGVGMIQLRDKQLADRDLAGRGRLLRKLTRGTSTLAIVNDRADIAATVDADGVHLGQEDLSVHEARSVVGPRMLVGVSTHNLAQARAAVLDGANYLGAGPTFASQTKSFDELAGPDYLRAVAAEIGLPTFAIGGIDADNLPDVLATGVRRVAVGSAVVPVARHGESRATAATSPPEAALAAGRLLSILENTDARTPVAEATSSCLTPDP